MDIHIKKTTTLTNLEVEDLCALVSESDLMQKYRTNTEQFKGKWGNPDPNDLFYLAVSDSDQSLVGFAWLQLKAAFGRSPYLKLLLIKKDAQGKGVGMSLIGKIETEFLKASGLFVLANSNNLNANDFYKKLGYHSIGILKNYVLTGQDEVIFWKQKNLP